MNRFENPLQRNFKTNYYVDEMWTPDFKMWGQAIQQQQKEFDQMQNSSLGIDALQGKDTVRAKELMNEVEQKKQQIVDMYAKQDFNSARRMSRELGNDMSKKILPGGEAYNINNRKKTYLEHDKKLKEAFQKGDISEQSYRYSTQRNLDEYNATAYDPEGNLDLSSVGKEVSADEYANKFLKNVKADGKYNPDAIKYRNGKYTIDRTKVTEVEYQELLNALSQGFKTEAQKTGQLNAYSYYNLNDDIRNQYKQATEQYAQQAESYNKFKESLYNDNGEVIDTDNETAVKKMQEELKNLGYEIEADGKYGQKTQAAMSDAVNNFKGLQSQISSLSNPDEYFIDQYIQEQMQPYAYAGSFRDEDKKTINLGDTFSQFKRKEDYKKKQDEIVAQARTGTLDKANALAAAGIEKDGDVYRLNGTAWKRLEKRAAERKAKSDKNWEEADGIIESGIAGTQNFFTRLGESVSSIYQYMFDEDDILDETSEPFVATQNRILREKEQAWSQMDGSQKQEFAQKNNMSVSEFEKEFKSVDTEETFKYLMNQEGVQTSRDVFSVYGEKKAKAEEEAYFGRGIIDNKRIRARAAGSFFDESGGDEYLRSEDLQELQQAIKEDYKKPKGEREYHIKGEVETDNQYLPKGTKIISGPDGQEFFMEPDLGDIYEGNGYKPEFINNLIQVAKNSMGSMALRKTDLGTVRVQVHNDKNDTYSVYYE